MAPFGEPLPRAAVVGAIDVSSYQPQDLGALIHAYQPGLVIVRLYLPWERISSAWSLAQISSAHENGCEVGGYCWLYGDADPVETVRAALEVWTSSVAPAALQTLWIDVELYGGRLPELAQVRRAVQAALDLGVPQAGIYTSRHVWMEQYGDSRDLGWCPLWAAQYDDIPTLESVRPFGGWTRATAKQYTSVPVDRSVFERQNGEGTPVDSSVFQRSGEA